MVDRNQMLKSLMSNFSWIVAVWIVSPVVYGQTSDWPSFLGPDRNGKSDESGILKDWTNGKLAVIWERPVGRGYVLGSVADGKFFQFDALGKICRLICRDAKSGDEIWRYEYEFEYQDMYQFDSGPRSTPVIDGGNVYIYGVEGRLHCLANKTGELVWKKDINKEYGVVQNFFGVGSTPIVNDDKLIVMVGGSPDEFQGQTNNRLDKVKPNGSAVVAFDKLTGKEKYRLGNDLASYSSIILYPGKETSGASNNQLAVAWLRDKAIGFQASDGKQLWSYPYRARKYESVNAATPVVKKTQIFLCESYGPGSVLLDVNDNQPQVIWQDTNPRRQSLGTHWNTPVLHDGYLYACHGESGANCEIRCVEFETGTVKWKKRGFARSSLTYADGHLVVLDERGKLFLIKADPKKFDLVSDYQNAEREGLKLQYPCWAAPVIANGLLYVRGKDRLVCLKLKP